MSVPRTGQALIARPRLGNLLAQAPHARLTLVSGPAGFGKTTLLAGWLDSPRQQGSPVSGVALEASEDDPERLWPSVVTALDRAYPGTIPDAVELAEAAT